MINRPVRMTGFILLLMALLTPFRPGLRAQDLSIPGLDPQSFQTYVRTADLVQLLDCRSQEEYSQGHLKGSILIDYRREDFLSIARRVLNPDMPVAIYCRGGRRSRQATVLLKEAGFREVVNLDKGYEDWVSAGLPVEH